MAYVFSQRFFHLLAHEYKRAEAERTWRKSNQSKKKIFSVFCIFTFFFTSHAPSVFQCVPTHLCMKRHLMNRVHLKNDWMRDSAFQSVKVHVNCDVTRSELALASAGRDQIRLYRWCWTSSETPDDKTTLSARLSFSSLPSYKSASCRPRA